MTLAVGQRTLDLDPRTVVGAVKREVASESLPLRAWFGLLTVLIVVGAYGALLALPPGDEVLGTKPTFEWGLLIMAYVFFAITTSGLCLASSLGTVFGIEMFVPLEKRHAILAVLSLVTAFGIIALDLHYPVRLVFGAVLSPSPSSPMWWMGVLYGMYLMFLLTEVASMFTAHWSIHRAACLASSVTAIFAPMTLGAVFGVIAARTFWYGLLTPPFMIVSAFLSGTALLGIVFYCVHRFELVGFERARSLAIPAIRLLLTIAVAVAILFLIVETMLGLTSSVPGQAEATRALVIGPLAPASWGIRVLLGLVVPLVLLTLPRTRNPEGLFAASILAFVGLLTDRVLFVAGGQIAPTTAAAGTVASPYTSYTPTFVEISILVAAFASIALVYTLAERFLDMSEHTGHSVSRLFASTPPTKRRPASYAESSELFGGVL
jgi:Ni/Fe-hydrogenase subunit HybB-like protein